MELGFLSFRALSSIIDVFLTRNDIFSINADCEIKIEDNDFLENKLGEV